MQPGGTWTAAEEQGGHSGLRRWNQGFPPLPSGVEVAYLIFNRSQICLGEKAKEEMNLVEILPPACQEDKKTKPITIASLQASVLPMVSLSPQT